MNTAPATPLILPNIGVYQRNTPQHGDALALLRSLPNSYAPLAFFDPQFRGLLDKLQYGNEGVRQNKRFNLPAMTADYIDAVS